MSTLQLGIRIKELRAQRKLSQDALAGRASIARSYLAEIETGKRNPAWKNIEKILGALEVSPREFFDEPLFDDIQPQAKPKVKKQEKIENAYIRV